MYKNIYNLYFIGVDSFKGKSSIRTDKLLEFKRSKAVIWLVSEMY
jgi:hypothetical protein